jgi:hypothetical protein
MKSKFTKLLFTILLLNQFLVLGAQNTDLGPHFEKRDKVDICYMIFKVEKIKDPTDKQFARWTTNTFKTLGQDYSTLNGLISKSDYDNMTQKFKEGNYYKPGIFWTDIHQHLGPATNVTYPCWKNIQYDNRVQTGYYKIEFK